MEERVGEKPVLLLDDVLSELDETRQGLLMEAVAPFSNHFDLHCAAPQAQYRRGISGKKRLSFAPFLSAAPVSIIYP